MRYGIIDIGSNTIRTVVYDCVNGSTGVILNETDDANLYDYIKNGVLTEDGIIRLIQSLNESKIQCRLAKSKNNVYVGTAALRAADNKDEILSRVRAECEIDIRLLSGKEEAYYDYLGIKHTHSYNSGAAFDLGGGSCQIFTFSDDGILEYNSLPIGTRRVFNEYLRPDAYPSKSDIKRIKTGISKLLKENFTKGSAANGVLYAMGGTCRALAYVVSALHRRTPVLREGFIITTDDLEEIIDMIIGEYMMFERLAKSISPKRVNTITSGVAELTAMCEYFSASSVCVIGCGLREGVLYEQLELAKAEQNAPSV